MGRGRRCALHRVTGRRRRCRARIVFFLQLVALDHELRPRIMTMSTIAPDADMSTWVSCDRPRATEVHGLTCDSSVESSRSLPQLLSNTHYVHLGRTYKTVLVPFGHASSHFSLATIGRIVMSLLQRIGVIGLDGCEEKVTVLMVEQRCGVSAHALHKTCVKMDCLAA